MNNKYKVYPNDSAIRADIKAKQAALDAKKARFSDFVLTTLEESPVWNSDTIASIADFAETLGLAKHGENDQFMKA
jgi:hypothetical protein